jgi:transcriptional regulator of acetoin/glycerol metabolism
MQPTSYPIRQELLDRLWTFFMATGHLAEEDKVLADPLVLQSWRRCAPRMDPGAEPRPVLVREQTLAWWRKAQGELITVATPIIEDIHQFIEGSNCAILLLDGTGCVLAIQGDDSFVAHLTARDLASGSYWTEGQLGTNAVSLALSNAVPVQVVGPEHYYRAYHDVVSTAAPIHDVKGRIIGALAIIGPAAGATSHSMGLVMSAVKAISSQLQVHLFFEEANQRLAAINAVLDTLVGGIVAWDGDGRIQHMNVQAGDMLNVAPAAAVGHLLTDLITLPAPMQQAVEEKQELHDVEVTCDSGGTPRSALVRLRFIGGGEGEPAGYVALLRPIEYVRRLVHQQVGSQASVTLEDIQAESTAMRTLLRQARIAARGTAPVLLRGHGGVGKNLLARAIHNDGKRRDNPFLAINCQAIPHELMVREFLGYEKQAGTDGCPSKFELAHGGTLLVDQIESLSLEAQAALLSVIESGCVMRLGGVRPMGVDVRIVAATSVNLEQHVADGRFLADLYYRFGVFSLTVPPLRHRVDDIPLLAERFLARITSRTGQPAWIDDEALAILKRYPWPGNVRELESVLERALYQSQDDIIRVADLAEGVRNGRVLKENSPQTLAPMTTAEAEREAILRAGWACSGRVSEMSRQLGIGRTTLWRKMKGLNLSADYFKKS